jgi:protein-S-isoprenylcysteine O-methyltransferase Ste14
MSTEQIIKLALFLVASASFAYLSRASLRVPASHGFYRFFAWESILVLFLLNIDVWFRNPFSLTQLISWFLLLVSGFLVLHGVYLLRHLGRAEEERRDVPLMSFEKTTTLVTVGAYRYIRHPLYSSLLFLAWAIFFKDPSLRGGLVGVVATAFLVATARADEAECVRFFGQAYQEYMRRTKMFIPLVV